MSAVVDVPIVCCSDCRSSFTYSQWRELREANSDDDSERRKCDGCSHVMLVPRTLLADASFAGGFPMRAERYDQLFPGKRLPAFTTVQAVASTDFAERHERMTQMARFWFLVALVAVIAIVLWLLFWMSQ
jgi:hypothetical protein